jgi:DNA-directed RNA polymerase subunit RPC12/RpoP
MNQETHSMLVRGVAAAKAGDNTEARNFLERIFYLDPPIDEKLEAWYWLSKISSDPKEKRDCLENILANNLGDARARRELAILNGELKREDIIDADRLSINPEKPGQKPGVDRFTCPNCGSRMVFAPDGASLVCEACASKEQIRNDMKVGNVHGNNFVVALATAKGHLRPMNAHTYTCEGCGAGFIVPPEQLTMVCPYCDSTYVAKQVETREILTPNGVIPFRINKEQAKKALRNWFDGQPPWVAPGKPLYLPVWVFDLGGQLNWDAQVYDNQDKKWVLQRDQKALHYSDLIILATRRFPDELQPAAQDFSLKGVVPYDPRYLVSWPAETYQISLGDASLIARQITLDKERQTIKNCYLRAMRNLHIDSSNLIVESYRLILFPVWLTHYMLDEKRYEVFVNGQSGEVYGEEPETGIRKWLGKFLGDS